MSRFVWVGVLLAVLLAQSAPAASCFTGRASMPCCEPGSDCAMAGLNAPSCCGVQAPLDRQEDGDRHRGALPPLPDRQATMIADVPAALAYDALSKSLDVTGSPPRDHGTPIYLRHGALLI